MLLTNLHRQKNFVRMRESSYNRTGGNGDNVVIGAGAEHTIPTFTGPGIFRHIWMTFNLIEKSPSLEAYRNIELLIRFDDAAHPQVKVPISDFFLFGHGMLVDVNSIPIQVSRQPIDRGAPYAGSLNCLFPMPFDKQASISISNKNSNDIAIYYYIDWERYEAFSEPSLYFHTTLNSEQTQPPAGQPRQTHGDLDPTITNLEWDENYVFLDINNYRGHYVGTGLSIKCCPGGAGKWWEGDDMFVIDDEPWPPRLHGTGTEDYFNLAWGFRKVECRPEYGVTYIDRRESDTNQVDGRFSMYRFHMNDPIPFLKSLHASIEHGHANDCEAYYRSVAYWYGRPLV